MSCDTKKQTEIFFSGTAKNIFMHLWLSLVTKISKYMWYNLPDLTVYILAGGVGKSALTIQLIQN